MEENTREKRDENIQKDFAEAICIALSQSICGKKLKGGTKTALARVVQGK